MKFETPARSARLIHAEGLAQGKLLYQVDEVAHAAVFPPREAGPSGRPEALAWRTSTGVGTIHTFTVLASTGANIVLADLDDGFRMMSTVVGGAAAALRIGLRVRARIEPFGGAHRVVFEALP